MNTEPQYLYVSPDLSYFEVPKRIEPPREFGFDGKQYRRLDQQYYAWLRSKVELFTKILDKSKLKLDESKLNDWKTAMDRFANIHEWAAKRASYQALHEIAAKTDISSYVPPRFGVAPNNQNLTSTR